MPGFLLHQGATVLCTHGGPAQPMTPNPRVQVGGRPVVTQPPPYAIAGCPFTTGGGPQPCVTGQWTTAATRVFVQGIPVVVVGSQSVCTPNGTPLMIVVTQARVTGT